ncbi:hypothetical protein [Streptomyces sp. CCM_MD2014]|uniref:hypothetical protein n=1 Tax=Streptomyces sp. CCM_MD2014 TaxID=1561022 RepID=UPI000AE3AE65|nr:hypothetical protein [Streptomyces sp. CCM_MD2014]
MASTDEDSRLLPQSVREKLEAIVFDANSFPHGALRLNTLKEWERWAHLVDLEVWLPEPVVWELAEHAASAWTEFDAITKKASKALTNAGVEVQARSAHTTREEVIRKVETEIRALGPSLRVLQLDGDVAIEALKDQVLQRKPAKVRDKVKTGASDSAWLRQVLKTANNDPGKFVIVGSDADVYKAFETWGLAKPTMVPLRNLQGALFVLSEPDADLVEKISGFLRATVGSPLEGGRTPDRDLVLGDIKDPAALVDNPLVDQISDVDLVHLEAVVGLNQIKINHLTGVVSAQVFLSPAVEYSGLHIEENGTVWPQSGAIPGVVIRDVINFTLSGGSVIKAESQSGEAVAFGEQDKAFEEPENAFQEFLEALLLVPGIALAPGMSEAVTDLEVGGELTVFLGDHTLNVSTSDTGDGGWSASLTLTADGWSDSMNLWCEWDATKNPSEIPDMFPAWIICTDLASTWRVPGEWAAPTWIIQALIPKEEGQSPY